MILYRKTFLVLVLICSILMIISQNFGTRGFLVEEFLDWTTYINIDVVRVWASFQDSLIGYIPGLNILAYFPTVAGVLGIISAFSVFKDESSPKLLFKIVGLIAILAYAMFFLFGLFFGIFSSELAIPNLAGGYFCLIPGIILLILGIAIKKPEYMKGSARVDKEYYAIGGEPRGPAPPSITAPTIACPNCGAMLAADEVFCDNCGQYL